MKTITTCLLGDDRERTYDVVWLGTADWSGGRGEERLGELPTALIRHQEEEALVAQHPEHGWVSGDCCGQCRDFKAAAGYPKMTDARLEAAI